MSLVRTGGAQSVPLMNTTSFLRGLKSHWDRRIVTWS